MVYNIHDVLIKHGFEITVIIPSERTSKISSILNNKLNFIEYKELNKLQYILIKGSLKLAHLSYEYAKFYASEFLLQF